MRNTWQEAGGTMAAAFGVAACTPRREGIAVMGQLIAGLVLFIGVHLIPTLPTLKARLTNTVGNLGYQAVFGLGSLAGLVLISMGYDDARYVVPTGLAPPPTWVKHIVLLLMLPAMIAIAAAYIPSRIRDVLQHPMLVAIKIWALAHLIANYDDGAAILLFGGFLAWAVYDRISVKKRALTGENVRGPVGSASAGLMGDIAVVAVGLLAYVTVAFWFHPQIMGYAIIGS